MHLMAGFLSLALLQTGPEASAEKTDAEKALLKKWMEFYTQEASQYEISLNADKQIKLEFQPKIILKYTNPARGRRQHGAFYVWTYDGRPEAVGTMWTVLDRIDTTKRNLAHEFHSLSLSPLISKRPQRIGKRGVVPLWSPQGPGIKLEKVSNTDAPAKTMSGRLIQMRRIARDFSAVSIHPDENNERELRLLPQPLYCYKSDSAKVVDGALFTFVMGTDPELLLLIENRIVNGKPHWHFAAARYSHIPLKLRRGGRIVWECEEAEPYVGRNPYFVYWNVSQVDADLGGNLERAD